MSASSFASPGEEAVKPGVDFELPYDAQGKVNWAVLGKILTAKLLGEVVYASHVDRKHTDKNLSESFKADTEWEYCYEKDEVVVLRKKQHRTCFMGRGVIDKPLTLVSEFIKDVQSTFIWDNLLVEARYVKVLNESEASSDYIGYQLFETIQRCGLINIRRDMLYYARCTYIDGKYVQAGVSVSDPDYPPQRDLTRMTMHMGSGFVAEPYHRNPQQTLLSYMVHIDTKGIPSVVNSQVLKRHPMAINQLRICLEKKRHSTDISPSSSQPSSPPTSPSSSKYNQSSRYYEQTLNVGHFMTDHSLP